MNYVSIFREGQQQLTADAGAETVLPVSDDIDASEFELAIPENELRRPRRLPVRFEQVNGLPIDRMISVEAVPEFHIPEDHVMAYRCRLCGRSDESLGELEHESCDLESEFSYEAHAGGLDVFTAIIRSEHSLLILEAGEATPPGTLVDRWGKGTPVHVWCADCSSGDDELDRIEHSEVCDLARENLDLPETTRTLPKPRVHADD